MDPRTFNSSAAHQFRRVTRRPQSLARVRPDLWGDFVATSQLTQQARLRSNETYAPRLCHSLGTTSSTQPTVRHRPYIHVHRRVTCTLTHATKAQRKRRYQLSRKSIAKVPGATLKFGRTHLEACTCGGSTQHTQFVPINATANSSHRGKAAQAQHGRLGSGTPNNVGSEVGQRSCSRVLPPHSCSPQRHDARRTNNTASVRAEDTKHFARTRSFLRVRTTSNGFHRKAIKPGSASGVCSTQGGTPAQQHSQAHREPLRVAQLRAYAQSPATRSTMHNPNCSRRHKEMAST